MARYKIVAHLIDPSLQDETTLTKEYLRDWEIIEKGGKEAMNLLYSKYPIDSNAYENFNSTMKYKLEQDADGIYLFKRCDDMTESKYKQTVKLNESQLKKIVAESVKRVLNEYAEGNEISPVPGDNYTPTPKSLIETIINEMQHIKTLCENTFQSIVHSDIGNARKGLSKMNQSLDVALDRANELQGFIDYNNNENY